MAEAGTDGALGVIRSLGRAGYPVHASSPDPSALGLRSRYAKYSAVSPGYRDPEFLEWLRRYVHHHRIKAIVPSENFAHAVRPAFLEFEHLFPLPPEIALFRGLTKTDVHETLTSAGGQACANLPPTLCVDRNARVPSLAELRDLGHPLFLKVDAFHSRSAEPGRVVKANTPQEALVLLDDLLSHFSRVLIQGFVPGVGVGSFFLMWDESVLATFQHRRLHEVPPSGGVSSLRESAIIPAIQQDAIAKARALNWRGVGMMEYRVDSTAGEYYFIEFNGRFWGSLHLALFAGVDFPTLLMDAFHGRPQTAASYTSGVRCRNLLEINYVVNRLKDERLSLGGKVEFLLEYAWLSVNPSIYSDLLFPGDRLLWVIGLWKSMQALLSKRPS